MSLNYVVSDVISWCANSLKPAIKKGIKVSNTRKCCYLLKNCYFKTENSKDIQCIENIMLKYDHIYYIYPNTLCTFLIECLHESTGCAAYLRIEVWKQKELHVRIHKTQPYTWLHNWHELCQWSDEVRSLTFKSFFFL